MAAVLAVAAVAHPGSAGASGSATLDLGAAAFSPRIPRPLLVSASLPAPERVGIRLLTPSGRALGWIAKPQLRRYLRLRWNGRLDGRRVPDGRYRVAVVAPPHRLIAARPLAIDTVRPRLLRLRTFTIDRRPFSGDGRLLATISPNRDGLRDVAKVSFTLTEEATVRFVVNRTGFLRAQPVYEQIVRLPAGPHTLTWFPPRTIAPRTYLVRLHAVDSAGNRHIYGASNAESGRRPTAPVIRVLGVDAGFTRESYAPGDKAVLRIETDARALSLQIYRGGTETVPTYDDTVMNGTPVGPVVPLPWQRRRDGPATVRVLVGAWPSGLYFARLESDDGRLGFAPFVVRPAQLGASSRIAVVLPTNTWQAYNFRDEDGDGWGDTWYAKGAQSTVRLGRAFLRRGVPPQYRKYDLGFLRWLASSGKQPDYLTESDLEAIPSGDELARLYDAVWLPGHTEYVTAHEYDVLQRYRDLGGNLAFLSANNLFWEVRRTGDVLTRIRRWRDAGRPEAALIGVQYRANDDGQRQRPFVVRGADAAPWLFAGTGLANGSTFGQELGGYGIEIDATAPQTPPGTIVLAEIPDLYGPGYTAQMTYYETPAGAKVFAAGAIDVGGTALLPQVSRMLENLWARLAVP